MYVGVYQVNFTWSYQICWVAAWTHKLQVLSINTVYSLWSNVIQYATILQHSLSVPIGVGLFLSLSLCCPLCLWSQYQKHPARYATRLYAIWTVWILLSCEVDLIESPPYLAVIFCHLPVINICLLYSPSTKVWVSKQHHTAGAHTWVKLHRG